VKIADAYTVIEKMPMQYETTTERIETSPATTRWEKKRADKNCLSANPDDCLVWCVVEIPASYTTITKRVAKGCAAGYVSNGDDCTKTVEVPAQYAKRTIERLKTPASTTSVTIPAKYETRSYQKLVAPASTTSVTVPAKYETRSYQKLVAPASTSTVTIPAKMGKRSFQKMVAPATTEVVEIPAKYETRSYKKYNNATAVSTDVAPQYVTAKYEKLDAEASTTSTETAAQYTTRTYEKLVADATSSNVAAVGGNTFETITYKKLVEPATIRRIDVPAEYTTITKRKLIKAGGFSEWREIVCDADVTTDLVRRVQKALMDRGYDIGPAGTDNVMGTATKNALIKYQKEKGLPIGSLDFETLKSLGVK